MNAIKSFEISGSSIESLNGGKVKIYHDDCPDSPREYCNAFTLYYTSTRYILGDIRIKDPMELELQIKESNAIAFPYYAFIHSGVALSSGKFNCPWDSGQCGIAVMEDKVFEKEFGRDMDKAIKCLNQELETFQQYISGDVYGFEIIDKNGNIVDSLWGMYGLDYAIDEASSAYGMNLMDCE